MTQSGIFWTQRLAVSNEQYVKVVATSSVAEKARSTLVPLFRAKGRSLKNGLTDVNWGFTGSHPPELRSIETWVWLDPAMLSLAPAGTSFPVPISPHNPLYRFQVGDDAYIVDSVTLIQRCVALQEKLFGALMSPFRDLIMRTHRDDGVVSLVVNTKPFYTTRFPLTILSDTAASSIAYWTSRQHRLDGLAKCGASIVRGDQLFVPQLDCPILARLRGMTDGEVTYVQSLMPSSSGPGARNALWQDGWTSIRLVEARKGIGQEIFRQSLAHDEALSWYLTAGKREKRQRRHLTEREVEDVRRTVGWLHR